MADIFLARATSEAEVERHVVLKRVLASRSRDPHFAKMFLDEARLASQLHHPNIAQVHDIGKLAGSYFFTMEYVHGEDVRHIMQRLGALRRPMPISHALHVAAGTLAALHHAHERTGAGGQPLQIVHRDVSPSNVMIAYAGVVKLLDFGVAKASERTHESHAGTVKGKIAYLSPEQCEGVKIDRRSDIFSLGIVLHEMLTGRRLFRRESDFATMLAIAKEDAPRPSEARPELTPEIDQIVMNALSRRPDDRYPTAADMLEAIEAIASKEHHVMSAFAMGKFMKELFGERPEPWLELEAAQENTQHITVTSELFMLDDELSNAVLLEGSRTALNPAESELEAQLDAAKPLFLPEEGEGDGVAPTPSARVHPLQRDSARMRTMTGPQMPLPAPPPGVETPFSVPTSIETSPFGKALEEVKPRTRIIIAIVACTIVAAVVAIIMQRSVPSPSAANTPDAAVIVMTAVDASVATTTPDAAVVVDPPKPRATIAEAFAASHWAEVLDLCVATKLRELNGDDRERCAIAACNGRRSRLAAMYHKVASRSDRPRIERKCKDRGIDLVRDEEPTKDVCEANPLKCR